MTFVVAIATHQELRRSSQSPLCQNSPSHSPEFYGVSSCGGKVGGSRCVELGAGVGLGVGFVVGIAVGCGVGRGVGLGVG